MASYLVFSASLPSSLVMAAEGGVSARLLNQEVSGHRRPVPGCGHLLPRQVLAQFPSEIIDASHQLRVFGLCVCSARNGSATAPLRNSIKGPQDPFLVSDGQPSLQLRTASLCAGLAIPDRRFPCHPRTRRR